MEGLNIWGISMFVMPIILVIMIGLISIIISTIDLISKLIKR